MLFFFCFTFTYVFKSIDVNLTTKFSLEGRGQCFNLTEISNQKHMFFMWFTSNGLQSVHVHSSHSNSKNQDSWVTCFSSNLCHRILRSPICHYHDNSGHILPQRSSPFCLWKRNVHCILQSQASHGASGQVHHPPHCPFDFLLPPESLQRKLLLDGAAVLNQTHACGVGADVQKLQDAQNELLHFFKVVMAHTARAVNDENKVQTFVVASVF